jgi:hypothetical protein
MGHGSRHGGEGLHDDGDGDGDGNERMEREMRKVKRPLSPGMAQWRREGEIVDRGAEGELFGESIETTHTCVSLMGCGQGNMRYV